MMEYVPAARELAKNKRLAVGTVDSWLIYKLTKGRAHKTDYSNASRTQLFNIKELKWDKDLCEMFSIPEEALPEVCMSDSVFGMTDMCGLSDREIPICGVAGDSHAALFGHNCRSFGNIKATYGTGSSVMMNTGETPIFNQSGIVTSIAWGVDGTVSYCLEGNLNYTGGVISWLKDDVKLISGAGETEKLAFEAKPEDNTCFVPAFTGLGAPYWNPDVKGMLTGISRTTGKREIVKACLECIGYQINDLIELMREEISADRIELCADGGASANRYLMQFQSDIADVNIKVPEFKELSAMGAAYMAGISAGLYDRERIFGNVRHVTYTPQISDTMRLEKRKIWKNAVRQALEYKS